MREERVERGVSSGRKSSRYLRSPISDADGHAAHILTGVLEENEETKLGGMGRKTHEQNEITPNNQGQAIVPSVPC